MSINDKFGIIENHIQTLDSKSLITKIENYFENYLNSDTYVLVSDLINQVTWFNNLNLEDSLISINSQLKNYLTQRRNNIRTFIKKETFELRNLNKFLKSFINKLEYINSIIKTHDNKVNKEGIKLLSNLILSDSIITIFLEEQITQFEKSLLDDIKTLVLLIRGLGKYDNFEIYNKVLTTFGQIFIKKIMEIEEPPLPINIKRINKLNESIKYAQQIEEYFKFIVEDFNKISIKLHPLILENLLDVINNNNLEEVEYVFNNIWKYINNIINESVFEQKEQLLINISNGTVNLIKNSLNKEKYQIKLQLESTIAIVNILRLMDSIKQNDFKEIVKQKISSILSNENLIDNVQIYLDMLIRNHKQVEARKLIEFITNVKDADLFVYKYNQYLTKRLMDIISNTLETKKTCEYFVLEKDIANYLKLKFGNKMIYKINKIIKDTECSFNDLIAFNELFKRDKNKVSVLTTSYNTWDINYSENEGIVTSEEISDIKETQLGKCLISYDKFYELKYNNKRCLTWYPHFGEVDITYLGKNIKMLPIQFMVLEMFNEKNHIPIQNIKDAKFLIRYNDNFKNNIIKSFISSKLLNIVNDNIVLSTTENFNTNLIDIFFNISDYTNIWEQKRMNELANERVDIVCTNINHFIKRKPMTKDELYKIIYTSLKVFELNDEVFNKAIEHMCKMDYIVLNNGLYEKLFY